MSRSEFHRSWLRLLRYRNFNIKRCQLVPKRLNGFLCKGVTLVYCLVGAEYRGHVMKGASATIATQINPTSAMIPVIRSAARCAYAQPPANRAATIAITRYHSTPLRRTRGIVHLDRL